MDLELTRLAVLYVHLIACCVAIGMILTSDVAMVRALAKGDAGPGRQDAHLHSLQVTVSRALLALWLTGIAIIALDVWEKGQIYFDNPKLQAKITIVCLLTLNGMLLHRYVLPAMAYAGSLLSMSFNARLLAVFAGAVSGVSWMYAAMLGVGRPLAWKYTLAELMAAYPLLIAAGFVSMTMLTLWSRHHERTRAPMFEVTGLTAAGI
jgi:hypothetical protein